MGGKSPPFLYKSSYEKSFISIRRNPEIPHTPPRGVNIQSLIKIVLNINDLWRSQWFFV